MSVYSPVMPVAKRTNRFEMLLTPDERKTFDRTAALQGLKTFEWARMRLRQIAEEELSVRGQRAPWSAT